MNLAAHYLAPHEGEAPPEPPKPKAPRAPKPGKVPLPRPDDSPDRAEIDTVYHGSGLKTTAEVEKTLRARLKSSLGVSAGQVSLENLNPRQAAKVAAEWEHLAREHPDAAREFSIDTRTHPNLVGSSWATATMHDGTAHVNPLFFNTINFKDSIAMSALTGFHPSNCTDVESVVAHEFGHCVEGWARKKSADYRGLFPDFGETRNEWSLQGLDYEILSTASDYARSNRREAFAESFADYTMWRRARQAGAYQSPKTAAARAMETWLVGRQVGDEVTRPNGLSPARRDDKIG